MTRSWRHKSHKQSKHSDSKRKDVKMKENDSVRISKDLVIGEKRKLVSQEKDLYSYGNVDTVKETVSSKRRRDDVDKSVKSKEKSKRYESGGKNVVSMVEREDNRSENRSESKRKSERDNEKKGQKSKLEVYTVDMNVSKRSKYEDIKDIDEKRVSSKGDRVKEGRYRDEKYNDKYLRTDKYIENDDRGMRGKYVEDSVTNNRNKEENQHQNDYEKEFQEKRTRESKFSGGPHHEKSCTLGYDDQKNDLGRRKIIIDTKTKSKDTEKRCATHIIPQASPRDEYSSPKKEKSPLITIRRNVEVKDSGQRSGGPGPRPIGDEFNNNNNLSVRRGNSKQQPPLLPLPFYPCEDEKLNIRHRRILGGVHHHYHQGNGWRGMGPPPNWWNGFGFMPFHHPMMQHFQAPPIFNPIPPLMGWRNDSFPLLESHHPFRRRQEWDHHHHGHGHHDRGGRNWETSENVRSDLQVETNETSQIQPCDEPEKKEITEITPDKTQVTDDITPVETDDIIPVETDEITPVETDEITPVENVYLSKLDISANLTEPELYIECMGDNNVNCDVEDSRILYMEEGAENEVKSSSSVLFAAVNNSVFQEAMDLYKKLTDEAKVISGGSHETKEVDMVVSLEVETSRHISKEKKCVGPAIEEESICSIGNMEEKKLVNSSVVCEAISESVNLSRIHAESTHS